jgi:hypothetical protein
MVTRCRHTVDTQALEALKALLRDLPDRAPKLLASLDIPPEAYADLLKMAVESLRGTQSADPKAKRRFIKAVLDHMVSEDTISEWTFVGGGGRQDYRIVMPDHSLVAIEAKGCGDGNNMTIWDRPAWASEFIIWSLCPESLQHQPGHGVWSAISTRPSPKIVHEQQQVDAFIFYDQRCGSDIRPCPKSYGLQGLRSQATDIKGQKTSVADGGGSGEDWLPPPSIYLMPQTVPQAVHNPSPPPHTVGTCRFAKAILKAFKVPTSAMDEIVSSVHIEVRQDPDGVYRRVTVYHGTSSAQAFPSGWVRLRR